LVVKLALCGTAQSVDSRLIPFTQMLAWIDDVHRNGLSEND
jgi:hypothetical protein